MGIIGLGLIGGSIAKRLIAQISAVNQIEVYAWNHSDRPKIEAEEIGIILKPSIADLLKLDLDFAIIATPISTFEVIFAEIASSDFSERTIFMDIASVKGYPLSLAQKFGISAQYVGTHPMYGTEFTGFSASSADLGNGAMWAVCDPTSHPISEHTCDPGATKLPSDQVRNPSKISLKTKDFIEQHLCGRVIFTDAEMHDKAVALSSHLPHILAYELSGIISEEGAHLELAKKLNAGSFHGATRVAHGNTSMFTDMLEHNASEILPYLDKVIWDLSQLSDAIKSELDYKRTKSIHHFIARSDEFRQNNGVAKPLHRNSGDGWVKCQCGKEHWGLNGAAGLFLVRVNEDDKVTAILLQHRALWSAEGGTWGTPGGAISMSETPVEGALREASEEAGVNAEDIEVLQTIERDHKNWQFTTVIAREKRGAKIVPSITDQESLEVKWVPIEKVRELPLLTAFGRELDELLERVNG